MPLRSRVKACLLFAFLFAALPLAAQPDLSVSQSGPSQANQGSSPTYSILIANVGSAAATSVVLTDPIPSGALFGSLSAPAGASCTTPPAGGTGTVSCSLASLPAGNSAAFGLVLTLTGAGGSTVTNTATAASSPADANAGNNSSPFSTVIASADVGIRKSGPATVGAGAPIAYAITMTNFGPTASAVNMHDPLPPQLTFLAVTQTSGPAYTCSTPPVGSNGTILCSGSVLPAGRSVSFNLAALVAPGTPAGTTITNTADVFPISTDPNPANDHAASGATVAAPGAAADLAVTKSGDAFVSPGSYAGYTVTVTNNGPNAATEVTLTDAMDGEFGGESQSSGPAFTCSTPSFGGSGPVTCTIASLPAGASATFAVSWKPSGAGMATTNVANVTSASPDPNPSNNSASQGTIIATADLSVSKTAPATATAGTSFPYTITVRNLGTTAAGPVTLSDPLPAQTRFVSLTQTAGPTFACSAPAPGTNGTIGCTLAALASGGSATFSVVVSTLPTASGTVSNTATFSAARGTNGDPVASNDTATATTALAASTAVPSLGGAALALLAVGLAVVGWMAVRR